MLVIATIGLALAIIAEATLSFLGQGIPPTTPSLGTLIRVGCRGQLLLVHVEVVLAHAEDTSGKARGDKNEVHHKAGA